MQTARVFAIGSVFLGLLAGCAKSTPLSPDPDGGIEECAGLADGSPCGSDAESTCDLADTCLAGVCVPNLAADGTSCGDATDDECDDPDTCQAGTCVGNFVDADTACGDPTDTACDDPDRCDGAGTCVANFADSDTACGDPTDTECDGADTCDGAGTCVDNLADVDSACGDATDTECDGADTCDGAGACRPNLAEVATACGDASDTECTDPDSCDGAGTCLANHVDATTACGDPNDTECDDPDVCDGLGACLPNFVAPDAPCGDATATDCDAADACDGAGACEPRTVDDGATCYDCDAGAGRCDVCSTGTCGNGPGCQITASSSLAASNTGGNNHRGNMFDVVASNTVRITSLEASPMGNTSISVYYKRGTWNGFANTPSAWTLIGTVPVTATGGLVPVPLDIGVTIPAGETYAFYVTSNTSAVSLNYSNGTAVGNVYASDANIQFLEGGGLEYPFTQGTGAVYQPRVWNGVIHYVLPDELGTVGAAHTGGIADGAMFDLEASDDVEVSTLAVELEAGTFDVDVYFRRGTFVGFEGSSEGWELLGGADGVASTGGGARSYLPLASPVFLSAGEVGALYVVTSGDGLRVDEGGAVGDVAITGGPLTIEVGRAIDSAFAGVGPAATARAVLFQNACE